MYGGVFLWYCYSLLNLSIMSRETGGFNPDIESKKHSLKDRIEQSRVRKENQEKKDREWENLGELGKSVAWTAQFNKIMDAYDSGKILLEDEEIEHLKNLIQVYGDKEELKLSLKDQFQKAIEKGQGHDYELFQVQFKAAESEQEKITEEFLREIDKYDEIINKQEDKPKKKGFLEGFFSR